ELNEALHPTLWLATGLILVTTLVVALVGHAAMPAMAWPVAFVLGAVLSPPDEVAIIAVADRLHIPHRIRMLLEGEGLVNDATALVVYRFAIVAALTGVFSPGKAALAFLAIMIGETTY